MDRREKIQTGMENLAIPLSGIRMLLLGVALILVLAPCTGEAQGESGLTGGFSDLLKMAGRESRPLERPEIREKLQRILDRMETELERDDADPVSTLGYLASRCRDRLAGRAVIDKFFGVALERLVAKRGKYPWTMEVWGNSLEESIDEIKALLSFSCEDGRVRIDFHLTPGGREALVPLMEREQDNSIRLVVASDAEPLLTPFRRKELSRQAGQAFPGHGPVRLEVGMAGSETIDIHALLHEWPIPFKKKSFGPFTVMAGEFHFRGCPVSRLDRSGEDGVASHPTVFSASRLERFHWVYDIERVRKDLGKGSKAAGMELSLVLPGEPFSFPCDWSADSATITNRLSDDTDFIIGKGKVLTGNGCQIENTGDHCGIHVSGKGLGGHLVSVLATLHPSKGRLGFLVSLMLADGRAHEPMFLFNYLHFAAADSIMDEAGKELREKLPYHPWLDAVSYRIIEGRQVLVLSGRGAPAESTSLTVDPKNDPLNQPAQAEGKKTGGEDGAEPTTDDSGQKKIPGPMEEYRPQDTPQPWWIEKD